MPEPLPQSLEAEQSCIGAMLVDRRAILKASERLSANDFYRENHRRIFAVLLDLSQRNETLDMIDVTEELRARGELEEVGGAAYLTALIDACTSSANIDAYIKPIERTATQRRVIALGRSIAAAAAEPMDSTTGLMEQLERGTIEITQKSKSTTLTALDAVLLPTFAELMRNYQNKGEISGLSSGFIDLDRKTTGFHPGNLIVVGARPGMGKSSFGLQAAQHAARTTGKPAAFFSLEMSPDEIIQRLLAMRAGIDISSLRRGYIENHFRPLGESFLELQNVPLHIDPTPAPTMFEIRARAHRLAAEKGLSLIVVDYLQRVNAGGLRGSRNEIVGQFARDLKSLARELKVPVIALAQINRGVEERDDKRPLKSDLRESGDIEAEADLILLLYRSSYYERKGSENEVEEAEIIIDKNRQGQGNTTVTMGWYGQCAQFVQHEPMDFQGGYA